MQNFIKAPIYCETKFDTEYAPAQQEKNCSSIWDGSIRHGKYLLMRPRKSLPPELFQRVSLLLQFVKEG